MPKKKTQSDPTLPTASLGASNVDEDQLDPKEEKMLDKILMGVVIFVLGWLAIGVLMAVGGLFGVWK